MQSLYPFYESISFDSTKEYMVHPLKSVSYALRQALDPRVSTQDKIENFLVAADECEEKGLAEESGHCKNCAQFALFGGYNSVVYTLTSMDDMRIVAAIQLNA